MLVIHRVKFDENERRTFKAMSLGVGVGFPDPQSKGKKRDQKNDDARAQSLLARLSKRNEEWNRSQLIEARDYLQHLVDVLAVEAEPEYWQAMVPGLTLAAQKVEASGKVAIIANPQFMIDTIVPIRQEFYASALHSLRIIKAALTLALVSPEEDVDDDWDLGGDE